jgi:bacillithiol biosynthesis deacetylase BshB1
VESHCDLLAIGAHPDDVEAACGGLLAKLAARGRHIAICDLTAGELGSNGSVEVREREAAAAARVLGVAQRLNLGLPDGGLDGGDATQTARVVRVMRQLRPRLVIAPHPRARHPDHVEAARLVRRARFFCGVHRFAPEVTAIPRPALIHGLDYHPMRAAFIVDVSEWMERKLEALRCYVSQFERSPGSQPTVLNAPAYLERIRAQARWYGMQIGCAHGEPYARTGGVPIDDPVAVFGAGEELGE